MCCRGTATSWLPDLSVGEVAHRLRQDKVALEICQLKWYKVAHLCLLLAWSHTPLKSISPTPISPARMIINMYLLPDRRFVLELLTRRSSTGYLLGASPRKHATLIRVAFLSLTLLLHAAHDWHVPLGAHGRGQSRRLRWNEMGCLAGALDPAKPQSSSGQAQAAGKFRSAALSMMC